MKTSNDIFKVGNRITTNNRNVLEILGVNESDICVVDTLNGDFDVLKKTEHDYAIADLEVILNVTLGEVITDAFLVGKTETEYRAFICEQMSARFNKWL
ncbi:MAG: hypothetical protein WC979_02315 [Candidatus Pacearchaeota archaeon]|jgi:hypothetical protein|nr:hypothetical protein [Clostridia bacterium]